VTGIFEHLNCLASIVLGSHVFCHIGQDGSLMPGWAPENMSYHETLDVLGQSYESALAPENTFKDYHHWTDDGVSGFFY
jgi:hypothetical protein